MGKRSSNFECADVVGEKTSGGQPLVFPRLWMGSPCQLSMWFSHPRPKPVNHWEQAHAAISAQFSIASWREGEIHLITRKHAFALLIVSAIRKAWRGVVSTCWPTVQTLRRWVNMSVVEHASATMFAFYPPFISSCLSAMSTTCCGRLAVVWIYPF
jgi:hypothetical protein